MAFCEDQAESELRSIVDAEPDKREEAHLLSIIHREKCGEELYKYLSSCLTYEVITDITSDYYEEFIKQIIEEEERELPSALDLIDKINTDITKTLAEEDDEINGLQNYKDLVNDDNDIESLEE
jgi:hypothetical protein